MAEVPRDPTQADSAITVGEIHNHTNLHQKSESVFKTESPKMSYAQGGSVGMKHPQC